MARNPIRPQLNRASQIKSEKEDVRQSVTLFDIDYAMMTYLEDVALPTLTAEQEQKIGKPDPGMNDIAL
jgi:hypothetical protein